MYEVLVAMVEKNVAAEFTNVARRHIAAKFSKGGWRVSVNPTDGPHWVVLHERN